MKTYFLQFDECAFLATYIRALNTSCKKHVKTIWLFLGHLFRIQRELTKEAWNICL